MGPSGNEQAVLLSGLTCEPANPSIIVTITITATVITTATGTVAAAVTASTERPTNRSGKEGTVCGGGG